MSFFNSPEGKLKKYTKQIKELNRSNHQQKLFDFCQRILEKHFNDFKMINNICGILELEKLNVLAEVFITRLIEIDPDNAIAYVSKALILINQGKNEEGFAYFDIAISMRPNDTTILVDKAVALQVIGLHQEAIDLFKRVLRKYPTQVATINALVYSLLAEKKFEEVKEYNEKALKINPSDPEALSQKQELQNVFGRNF